MEKDQEEKNKCCAECVCAEKGMGVIAKPCYSYEYYPDKDEGKEEPKKCKRWCTGDVTGQCFYVETTKSCLGPPVQRPMKVNLEGLQNMAQAIQERTCSGEGGEESHSRIYEFKATTCAKPVYKFKP